MRSTSQPTPEPKALPPIASLPDGNLALGQLIRVIESIQPPTVHPPQMAFSELKAWFHDRFNLQEESCSGKALGDALAFAIRLGLIPLKKVERTRLKITTYLGVDETTLDAALDRWRNPVERSGRGEATPEGALFDELPMDPPWDTHLDHDPTEALQWKHIECFELNRLDQGSEMADGDFDF